ncbi:hypothetical protein HNO89_003771 [Sporosarcina luteola]|nr:hypothetical protein [Sporosarcina luteola]
MSKKQKSIFIVSIAGNVFLIVCLVVGYLKMSLVHEELFYSEVQYKLAELEGLIDHQKRSDWPEPNLVTSQLGDVLNGIETAMNSGMYSGWLSNEDRSMMERLRAALSQYPHDELYSFSTVTESDTKDFEELQSKLRQVGIGMNMTISNDWKTFISSTEQLLKLSQNT